MTGRVVWSVVAACALVPGVGRAQHVAGHAGYTHNGYPYGPRVAPAWGYPNLAGGPFVTYAAPPWRAGAVAYEPLTPNVGVAVGVGPGFGYGYGYPGYFGYSGRAGSSWSNGLSLYGPPVPVYGPVPGVFGNNDLVRQWRSTLAPGLGGYGWVGVYAASPRPRPLTVSVYPTVERFSAAPAEVVPAPAAGGGCLMLSVRVPQPSAEVFVDGKKTAQTGTDRTFESPPLEAGQAYKYTVTARWIERGQVVESSREVSGTPGEVVRVDFGK